MKILQETAKVVLRGKFIVINTNIQILSPQLNNLYTSKNQKNIPKLAEGNNEDQSRNK